MNLAEVSDCCRAGALKASSLLKKVLEGILMHHQSSIDCIHVISKN